MNEVTGLFRGETLQEFDVVILGAGPAGYQAAIRAAQLGAKVCLIERDFIGGTCLNKGCIPTKALREYAQVLYTVKKADTFGIKISDFCVDFSKYRERKNRIVQRLRQGIDYLLKNHEIELITGEAFIKSPNIVEVNLSRKISLIKAKRIIIATGSKPNKSVFGEKNAEIISSDEVLDLAVIPKRMLIIGGGVIGCEFAGIFRELGSQVTIVEMMSQILPGKDEELARSLTNIFSRKGINIYTNSKVERVESNSSCLICKLDSGREFQVDKVVVAVGRHLNTENIGLEKLGVFTQERKILVNENMRTNIPDLYAAGDVTGGPYLAHLASLEGIVAAENACGKERVFNYNAIPECIYTHPEIASIGLTYSQAKKESKDVKTAKAMFVANGRALTLDEREGFIKIISDENEGKILGVHIIGAQASELINVISLAMNRGLKILDLVNSVYTHPSLSESIKEAAEKVLI